MTSLDMCQLMTLVPDCPTHVPNCVICEVRAVIDVQLPVLDMTPRTSSLHSGSWYSLMRHITFRVQYSIYLLEMCQLVTLVPDYVTKVAKCVICEVRAVYLVNNKIFLLIVSRQ